MNHHAKRFLVSVMIAATLTGCGNWSFPNPFAPSLPIEERDGDEVRLVSGLNSRGAEENVLICPPETRAANFSFDVTPARLISGLITERGVVEASEEGIIGLSPEPD